MLPTHAIHYAACFDQGALASLGNAKGECHGRHISVICINHIVFGVIRFQEETHTGILFKIGYDLTMLRQQMATVLGQGPSRVDISSTASFSDAASKALCWSVELARRTGLTQTPADYVLLAMLETNQEGIVAILNELGVSAEEVRKEAAMAYGIEPALLRPRGSEGLVLLPLEQIDIPIRFRPEVLEAVRKSGTWSNAFRALWEGVWGK